ncbi:hypothetical protein [Solicola gregarius]|uniref:GH26 domain-containing protein n=1 Tax=Solicola gregarius TaxID=2908642 RepID=A0AA46YMI3_9ACTN|nr:hypothetical protein [Solicola gregarius]UYM06551.1 hypothetical protein L0C25_05615 [Solicola gregarius]
MSSRRALLLVLAVAVAAALSAALLVRDESDSATETQFGTTVRVRGGESDASAVERLHREVGTPPIVRLFSSTLPAPWPRLTDIAGSADIVVSFKIAPSEVLAGAADTYLREWFASAPTDRDIYWVYFHEPEDDIERGAFSAREYSRASDRIARIAATADNPRLINTVVLMCWTVGGDTQRRVASYLAAEPPDVLAWDCYNAAARDGEYASPDSLFKESVAASKRVGAKWAIAEFGSPLVGHDDGDRRARWLHAVAAYAEQHQAEFVTYFNSTVGGDFELTDQPSQQAWRAIMAG